MNLAASEDVVALGKQIADAHDVVVLKKPEKILVMLKVRESAQNTLFYAGEALACECTVRIGDVKGFACCLGDDLDKVYAMAVIDAAINAKLPERGWCLIYNALSEWEQEITRRHAREAQLTLSTKVNFNVMEE